MAAGEQYRAGSEQTLRHVGGDLAGSRGTELGFERLRLADDVVGIDGHFG